MLMLVLALPSAAGAQAVPTSAVRPRVTDRVDVSRLTTLKGNTHRLAQPQFDQGAAPPDLPMNRILLVLQRSPEQETALQDLLTQQQINRSPNFHKWLTPDQFGRQFGPADADIQAVTSWLASFGFQNIRVSKGRVTIEFSGTASQVQAALHTPIHRYLVNGESHWANANDPQVPAALAPVIAGFASLHNFRSRPTMRTSGQKFPATVKPGQRPQIDLGSNGNTHALVPADFNKIYNVGSGMTGAGVTIGIVSDTDINLQDITDFRNMFGAPNNLPNIVHDGPDPGDLLGTAEGEAVLDATWASSVAPAATVDLVVSQDTDAVQGTDLSEVYIIDNNVADVMTESFSFCEAGATSGDASFYFDEAEQAAAQGITFLVSSGDGGPDSCDDPSVAPAATAASVNILAATPFNVAVGGTMFNEGSNASTYWNPPNLQAGNGESAKSYIPENVWNESCTLAQFNQNLCPAEGLWSSGGGVSAFFGKPVWQTGVTGIPATTARFVPDVAMNAADHDGYVLCIDGSCQGTGCPSGATVCFGIASGTSASAQVFGGIIALIDQKVGGRVGNANYVLYKLAAAEVTSPGLSSCNASNATTPPAAGCIFNDVTSGNTNVPGENGFTATTGFDQTTGLGSVNVSNLVNQWSSVQSEGSATLLTLNGGAAVNVPHGQFVPVDITVSPVSPATGAPTGDVSLIAGISPPNSGQGADFTSLSPGTNSSSATFGTNLLPGGTYNVHAHYSGDGKFLGSDSNDVSVTINPEASKTLIGLINENIAAFCSLTTSVAYGSPYILAVGVVDSTGGSGVPCLPSPSGTFPSGQVSLTDNGAPLDGGTFSLNSQGYFEDQPIQLTAGTHVIAASYLGDNSFSPSGPATINVTVSKATTATTATASPTSASLGQTVQLTATIAAANSNATASTSQEPTGTVQFSIDGTPVSTLGNVTGNAPGGAFAESTATIPAPSLSQGSHSVTAVYSGDNNYSGSSTSSPITVNVGIAGINVSSCAGGISIGTPGQSGTCLITVSGANGFSGTVTLSATVASGPSGAVYPPSCSSFSASNMITLSSSTTSGSATMTCSTTAAAGLMAPPSARPFGRGWPLAGVAVVLSGLFLFAATRRERRWSLVPLTILLAVIVLAGVSCNGNGYNPGGGSHPGTTAGTYTVTVTAMPSSGTAQTTTVSVVVQ